MTLSWSTVTGFFVLYGAGQEPNAAVPRNDAELAAYHARARTAISEVFELPEFAGLRSGRESFWNRVYEWLLSSLRWLGDSLEKLPSWLFWVIVVWLVLTLLAILGHFAYVLWGVIGASAAARRTAQAADQDGRGELLGIRDLDFDRVHARARGLLAAGEWLEATKYLYVAAILWLDRQGCVRFRNSKTNYDYVAEMSRVPEHRSRFRKLTLEFEATVYGGRAATADHCQEMASQVEVLLREVTPVVSV